MIGVDSPVRSIYVEHAVGGPTGVRCSRLERRSAALASPVKTVVVVVVVAVAVMVVVLVGLVVVVVVVVTTFVLCHVSLIP